MPPDPREPLHHGPPHPPRSNHVVSRRVRKGKQRGRSFVITSKDAGQANETFYRGACPLTENPGCNPSEQKLPAYSRRRWRTIFALRSGGKSYRAPILPTHYPSWVSYPSETCFPHSERINPARCAFSNILADTRGPPFSHIRRL